MPRRLVSRVPQGSTLTVRVAGIFDHEGAPQSDATVQVTGLEDKFSGAPVTGISLPISLLYVADWETRLDRDGKRVFHYDGNYEGSVSAANSMIAGGFYYATVVVTSSSGVVRRFREEIEVTAGEA